MRKNRSKHVNTTDINFSNSKSHTSNCIGKKKLCFGGSKSDLISNHGPNGEERRSRSAW